MPRDKFFSVLSGHVYEIVRDNQDPKRLVVRIQFNGIKVKPAFSLPYDDIAGKLSVGDKIALTVEKIT